jgi:dolichol-phosphate mannosyltransferase
VDQRRFRDGRDGSILVVIPTYNERANLARLVAQVLDVASNVEVLVVDDGSPDGTGEIAEQLAASTGRVHVLHRAGKQGLGTAYLAGFRFALDRAFRYVAQMDADFSHRPQDFARLLRAARGADLVLGSRYVRGGRVVGWSLLRQLISRGGSAYARTVLGLPVRDCTGGFKVFHRRVLESLDLSSVRANGYAFQVEMTCLAHRAGFRILEVPITFPDRTEGQSKMSGAIIQEAARLVWRLRRTVPVPRPVLVPALAPTVAGDLRIAA